MIARETPADADADRTRRALLVGALLYAVLLAAAYAIPSAVGGNADRLGALLAGPLAACVLLPRRALVLAVLAPFLLYWQVNAPLSDFGSAVSNPSVDRGYYAPLLAELRALGVGYGRRPARIEVVATRDHAEARFVAPHVALARGWERQLDVGRNALFYEAEAPLRSARYRAWLAQQAISYVALPDAPLDYSATSEGPLVASAGARSYLREVWSSRHWRLFAVLGATPLAQAPAVMSALGARLVHAARAARRQLRRARALHPLLGAGRRPRMRAERARRLDGGAGRRRGQPARRDPLLAVARARPRAALHLTPGRERVGRSIV